jgi:spermidine synthase
MPAASDRAYTDRASPRWLGGLYGLHAFTSLAYEMVWMRWLAASLGASLPAMGIVLAVFMGGLGLGAAALAWSARRWRLPAPWLFAGLQGMLGLWGALLPQLLGWLDQLYIAAMPAVESPLHQGLPLIISLMVLLPPACCIGAVFPLLGDVAHGAAQRTTGPGLERLYRAGLLWSGAGAVVTPFALLPMWGLSGTSLLLSALNGLGALGGLLAFNSPRQAVPEPHAAAATQPSAAPRPLLLLSALLGFCLFAVQLTGAQYLWLVVDATAYAEGIVLGSVLFGMAAGSTIAAARHRAQIAPPRRVLTGLGIIVVAHLIWLLLAADIARLFEGIIHQSLWVRSSALRYFAAHSALALTVLGGPAFAVGLIWPTLCVLVTRGQPNAVAPLGRLTAWHYLGSVGGATAGAFVMLPTLGVTGSLAALTAVALLACGLLWNPSRHARWTQGLAWGTLGVLALALFWVAVTVDVTFQAAAAGPHTRVIFHHEDASGIVEVYEDRATGHRTLLSSRLRQEGGNRPDDLRVQRLQGSLPVLLHPTPHHMLVVGLGTGISLAASLRPEVQQLTCVELSPGVIRAAAFFEPDSAGVLADPRLTLLQQDGRHAVKLMRQRYDLIVQDLFFPYRTGVGHLYTREHFQRLRDRLHAGGRAAQWIALNQVGPQELRSLVHTFTAVFPETSLWLVGGYLLLYGGLEPLSIDWDVFQRRFHSRPPTDQADPADFLGMFIASSEAVRRWAATAPLNTDDHPLIEYGAARTFAALNTVALAVDNLQALIPLHRPVAEHLTSLPAHDRARLEQVHAARRHLWDGIAARAGGEVEQARTHYEQAYALNPVNHQVRAFLEQDVATRGRQALLAGRYVEATALLQRALALNARHPQARFDLALSHAARGEDAFAVVHLRRLLEDQATFPQAHFNLGVSLYRLGRYAEAADAFAKAVAEEPSSAPAYFNLANSLAQSGRYAEAVPWYQRTIDMDPGHRLALENLQAIQVWLAQRGQQGD